MGMRKVSHGSLQQDTVFVGVIECELNFKGSGQQDSNTLNVNA